MHRLTKEARTGPGWGNPLPRPRNAGKFYDGGVPLSQKSARKLLEANEWTETLGGKHNVKMTKPGQRPITLPMHKGRDYAPGLTAAILRQAGLDKEAGR